MSRDAEVEAALEALPRMDRPSLYARYRSLYGVGAPARFSRQLLELAIAYRIQAAAYGDLSPAVKRAILSGQSPIRDRTASSGTVLIREWHGVHHTVTVHDQDVEYRGERFRSLSEVARLITGQRRSGPAFFGLKGVGQ